MRNRYRLLAFAAFILIGASLLVKLNSVSAQPGPLGFQVATVDAVSGAAKSSFYLGEPVAVVFSITNQSGTPQTITTPEQTEISVKLSGVINREPEPMVRQSMRGGTGGASVDPADGSVVFTTATPSSMTLAPGQTVQVRIDDLARFYATRLDDGSYTLTAAYNTAVQSQATFTIAIVEPLTVPVLQQMAASQTDSEGKVWANSYLELINKPSISGRITTAGAVGVADVNVEVTGSENTNVVTRPDGKYDLTRVTSGGSYTLTPRLKGYTFAPTQRTYSNVTTKLSGADFTATRDASMVNVASRDAGAVATASSTLSDDYPVESVNDNSRSGVDWGTGSGGWEDGTPNAFPDSVEVSFNGVKAIDVINVYTVQDNYANPVEPTPIQTFSLYGITEFDVQYLNGASWVNVPGGAINGNNNVWRKVTFPTISTTKIRVSVRNGLAGKSRITEIEALHANVAPTVSITGNYQGAPGATFQFSSNAADSDGSISRYDWGFGDNTSGTGPNPSHTYAVAGTFTVTLMVTDDGGEAAKATTTVTITGPPQAPIASAGGPYGGFTGSSVTFEGRGSYDPDGTINSYQWNFGDNTSGTGSTPAHTYAQPGTYTVTLTVTDDSGSTGTQTAVATIATAALPTVSITAPVNNSMFAPPASIVINATAGASNGNIGNLEFFQGNTKIGEDNSAPYSITWNNVPPGTYALTAKATDTAGTSTTSAPVNVTVGNLSQTISFDPIPNKTFGDASFTVNATASSGLPVSFTVASGPASVSGNTVSIVGAGSVTIQADQAGSDSFNPAQSVTQSFATAKAGASLSLSNLSPTYDGTPKSATATTNPAGLSGVSVTYGGSATVPTNAGSYAVVASLTNDNYQASNATGTLTIAKAAQTITFTQPPNKIYGDAPFTVSASASSGLGVSLSIVSGPATLSGSTITITGVGPVTVRAAQAGNANYNAAADLNRSFTIAKASATITLGTLSQTYDGTPKAVTATTNPVGLSGITVTYDGSTTAPTNAGSYAVVASLTNDNYQASNATGTLTIAKAAQTITFTQPPNKIYGDAPFTVSASASSGLGVSLSIVSGPATLSGSTITITGVGPVTVRAAQAGNANYNAAADLNRSFTVAKASATITLGSLSQTYNGTPRPATATTSPTGLSGVGITYNGSATAPTNAGSYAVAASLTNANYTASNATGTLIVAKATPALSWSNPADITYGTALGATQLNAAASFNGSSLAGTFSYTPAAGTMLNVGNNQVLSVTFTSADAGNFNAATGTAQINVNAAKTWDWKFDEGSGTLAADANGSTNQGTLLNGANWIPGKSGAALAFDGVNDMVSLSTSGLSDVTNNFTLSFWALPSATHQIDPETTSGYAGTGNQKYAFGPGWYDAGHAGAGVSVGTNGISVYEHASNYLPATLVYPATLTTWTHVSVVYENKQPKLYVNGVLVKTGLTSPMNFVHALPSNIGGMGYGYYGGALDEVRIYNRALSSAEVAGVYDSYTAPNSIVGNGTTDYLEVSNSSTINITGAFTAEAWVKTNSSTGAYQCIFERFGPSGTNGGFILRIAPSGKLEFFVLQSAQAGYPMTANTVVTSGVWHHVAATSDGTQMRVYLDGILDGSLSVSTYPATGTTNLFIGSGNWSGGRFNGKIDEARLTAGSLYSSNFTPQATLASTANTRGLWKFDSGSPGDFSGNGNNGMVRGAPTYSTDVAALANHSISFDGTSGRVSVPTSASLNITGPLTIETWFKLNTISGNQYLLSTATTNGGYLLMSNEGMPQLYITNSAGTSDFAIAWPANVTANEWHHMAGVFDGSQYRVYLNGVLCATKNSTIMPGSFNNNLSIGGYQGGSNLVNGLVDEVRISTGALYTANFVPQKHLMATANTKGLWKFDGQILQDASGNNNNGTLVGGAIYSNSVPKTNVARASNGATASASSVYGTGYPASAVINGDRRGLNGGSGGSWIDALPAYTFPDWVEVAFNETKTIDEIDVFTLQDNYSNPVEPTEQTTFAVYGLTAYDVQYWSGNAWVTVPGGSVSANDKVWRRFTFSPITTAKIRVRVNASPDGWSRMTELEAYSPSP